MYVRIRKQARKILEALGLLKKRIVTRNDLQRIDVQPNLYFLVYWKVLRIGKGPAVTLNAFDKEVLKFDCFGLGKGHYHISPFEHLRIYFTESSAKEQCNRTYNEIVINACRYLNSFPSRRVNALNVDQKKLERAAGQARDRMLSFLKKVDVLSDI